MWGAPASLANNCQADTWLAFSFPCCLAIVIKSKSPHQTPRSGPEPCLCFRKCPCCPIGDPYSVRRAKRNCCVLNNYTNAVVAFPRNLPETRCGCFSSSLGPGSGRGAFRKSVEEATRPNLGHGSRIDLLSKISWSPTGDGIEIDQQEHFTGAGAFPHFPISAWPARKTSTKTHVEEQRHTHAPP